MKIFGAQQTVVASRDVYSKTQGNGSCVPQDEKYWRHGGKGLTFEDGKGKCGLQGHTWHWGQQEGRFLNFDCSVSCLCLANSPWGKTNFSEAHWDATWIHYCKWRFCQPLSSMAPLWISKQHIQKLEVELGFNVPSGWSYISLYFCHLWVL